jgi:DNA-binding IclR family transcriptional regulator
MSAGTRTKTVRAPAKRRERKGDDSDIAAVARAAQILMSFSNSVDSLSLSEIAKLSGLSKPTALRLLATLAGDGMVAQHEGGTYSLGFLPLRAADAVLHGTPVWNAARPVMRQIRDNLNETVVLSIRQDEARYNIDCLESSHAIGQTQMIGVPIPLHCGAAGRVLLAGMSDAHIDDYVAHRARGEIAPDKLRRDLQLIRKQGLVASHGDYQPEGHAVACAIVTADHAAIAALHVSFPRGRFSKALEESCRAALIDGARAVSGTLAAQSKRR